MTKISQTLTEEARKALWKRILATARHLEKREPSPAARRPSVIQLREGSNEVPVFFIGYGLHELNLLQSITLDHPIHAVEVPWPAVWQHVAARSETEGLPTVEQIVLPYVAAIKAHTRSSRCVLAGHSFGGVMAFEASRQLAALNIQVEVVLLFNTAAVYPSSQQVAWQKLKEIWRDGPLLTTANLIAASTDNRFGSSLRIIHWMLADKIRSFGRRLIRVVVRPPEELTTKLDDTGRPITWPRIKYVYDNAMTSYRMSRLDCHGVLFRAKSAQNSASRSMELELGWKDRFGKGLEIVHVPGDHLTMMQQPHVSTLAAEISERLSQIFAKQEHRETVEATSDQGQPLG